MSKSIGSIFDATSANIEKDEEELERRKAEIEDYALSAEPIDTENYLRQNNGYLNINTLQDIFTDQNQNNFNTSQPTLATESNLQYAQSLDNNTSTDTEILTNAVDSTDEIFNRVFSRTLEEEGGYVSEPDKIDTPTNMGFQQATLDRFKAQHPDISYGFPEKIENLSYDQGRQIARKDYFDKYRIGEIKYKPLQETMFDSFFNHSPHSPALWAQKALNQNANISVVEDGIFGSQTIDALNSLSEEEMIKVNNAIIDQREADYEEEKRRNKNRFYKNYTRGLPSRFRRFRLR